MVFFYNIALSATAAYVSNICIYLMSFFNLDNLPLFLTTPQECSICLIFTSQSLSSTSSSMTQQTSFPFPFPPPQQFIALFDFITLESRRVFPHFVHFYCEARRGSGGEPTSDFSFFSFSLFLFFIFFS